jgi:hypothetical protein
MIACSVSRRPTHLPHSTHAASVSMNIVSFLSCTCHAPVDVLAQAVDIDVSDDFFCACRCL